MAVTHEITPISIKWQEKFSTFNSNRMNYVREILKLASDPEMILLSGGFPDPKTFPTEAVHRLIDEAIERYGSNIFQYGDSRGFLPLRLLSLKYLSDRGINTEVENVQIFTGSQQFLQLVGESLINPGDRIIVTKPTYLGVLSAWDKFRPQYREVDLESDGPNIKQLEHEIVDGVITGEAPKFIYLVPNFNNPSGETISLEKRQQIAALAQKYGVPIFEDDPYRELRYSGEHLPTIFSIAPDHTIYSSSSSKTLFPARLGIGVAPFELLQRVTYFKQGADLNTANFTQAIFAEYMKDGSMERHIPEIVGIYTPRLQVMLNALHEFFPREFTFTRPEGGMFVWVRGPKVFDSEKLLPIALAQKVAYVPGISFYANSDTAERNTLRLNFSNQPEERIIEGIKRLGVIFSSNQ
jgi:2-aminoadipate transaminase